MLAQWVKWLQHKHEDLSSDPPHSCERLAVVVLFLVKVGDRWRLGVCWLVSLTCWCFPNSWRNTALKSNVENSKRRQQMLTSALYPHLSMSPISIHSNTYMREDVDSFQLSIFDILFRFHYFTLGEAVLHTWVTKAVPSAYYIFLMKIHLSTYVCMFVYIE